MRSSFGLRRVALAVVLGAAGCSALSGLSGLTFDVSGTSGSGGSAGSDSKSSSGHTSSTTTGQTGGGGTSTTTGGCVHATYPPPPSGQDGTGAGSPIVVAWHSIDIGDGTTQPGYDLDDVCTCAFDAGGSCTPHGGSNAQCDSDGGVDNAATSLWGLLEATGGNTNFGSAYFSLNAFVGHWSMLVRIEGYDGLADDPNVDVRLYPSPGFDTDGGMPAWDGSDVWTTQMPVGSSQAHYDAAAAYVTNHTLVAAMPTVLVTLRGTADTISIGFENAILTGNLEKKHGLWQLNDGILAGRWSIQAVFDSLASYRDSNGMPLCTSSPGYPIAVNEVCSLPDILVSPGSKSMPCDAVSIGFGFQAIEAQLGPEVTPPTPSMNCPAGQSPADSTCGP